MASSERAEVTVMRPQTGDIHAAFHFDHVLGGFSSQQDVFDVTVEPLINDVLNGHEAAIFAYGQTGTGKTHTMEGCMESAESRGLVPRAAAQLLSAAASGIYESVKLSASCLEIYNEELTDLLASHPTRLDLKESLRGLVCRGLSEEPVTSMTDVYDIIRRTQERRRVAETHVHARSSRSHSLVTLRVRCLQKVQGAEVESFGKLHLVDLAGSECARPGGGAFRKEEEHERRKINQSLLTLRRVIAALHQGGGGRVPYRDSKLTRLLQDALGGSCRTVIIATISPAECGVEESLSTLSYAEQAMGILNRPVQLCRSTSQPDIGEAGDMSLRLQYATQETEEAQKALARKSEEVWELRRRIASLESHCQVASGKVDQLFDAAGVAIADVRAATRQAQEGMSEVVEQQGGALRARVEAVRSQAGRGAEPLLSGARAAAAELWELEASVGAAETAAREHLRSLVQEPLAAEAQRLAAAGPALQGHVEGLQACRLDADAAEATAAARRVEFAEILQALLRSRAVAAALPFPVLTALESLAPSLADRLLEEQLEAKVAELRSVQMSLMGSSAVTVSEASSPSLQSLITESTDSFRSAAEEAEREVEALRATARREREVVAALAAQKQRLEAETEQAQEALGSLKRELQACRARVTAMEAEQQQQGEAAVAAVVRGLEASLREQIGGLHRSLVQGCSDTRARLDNADSAASTLGMQIESFASTTQATAGEVTTLAGAWAAEADGACQALEASAGKSARTQQRLSEESDRLLHTLEGDLRNVEGGVQSAAQGLSKRRSESERLSGAARQGLEAWQAEDERHSAALHEASDRRAADAAQDAQGAAQLLCVLAVAAEEPGLSTAMEALTIGAEVAHRCTETCDAHLTAVAEDRRQELRTLVASAERLEGLEEAARPALAALETATSELQDAALEFHGATRAAAARAAEALDTPLGSLSERIEQDRASMASWRLATTPEAGSQRSSLDGTVSPASFRGPQPAVKVAKISSESAILRPTGPRKVLGELCVN